jgi:hypothetical protein
MEQGTQMIQEGPVELSWDADTRLGALRFVESGVGTGRDAERLTTQFRTWVDGGEGGPFRLLVDCSEMVDVDAGWRNTWGDFFKSQRHRGTVGWFNAGARIRLVIIMFQKGTGVAGKAFATEAEARRYLEQVAEPS